MPVKNSKKNSTTHKMESKTTEKQSHMFGDDCYFKDSFVAKPNKQMVMSNDYKITRYRDKDNKRIVTFCWAYDPKYNVLRYGATVYRVTEKLPFPTTEKHLRYKTYTNKLDVSGTRPPKKYRLGNNKTAIARFLDEPIIVTDFYCGNTFSSDNNDKRNAYNKLINMMRNCVIKLGVSSHKNSPKIVHYQDL